MNTIKILFHIFLVFAFLAGIYVCLTNGIINNMTIVEPAIKENLDNSKDLNIDCPDLLIKRGNKLLLYNTKVLQVDGVNPLPFNSLDEYIKYMDTQKKGGVQCPVLFLQEENDAQGKDVFRMRPSPFYVEGGLPPLPMDIHDNKVIQNIVDASRENPPYNANNHAGFDPYGQYVGRYTNIDQIHTSTIGGDNTISENPMDPNWGGIQITQDAVKSGKYAENEVRPAMYPKMPTQL